MGVRHHSYPYGYSHAGPPGLHYAGQSASLVEVTKEDDLTFELRVLNFGIPTVCDSIGQAPFETSKMLEARSPTPDSNCFVAFGSFSQPYTISVIQRRF